MTTGTPARRRAQANVRVGVGTRFAYDGETVTIIEMFPAGGGNEVLVEDRAGRRRYRLALRELLASERASIIADDDQGPRSDDAIETAGVILANLDAQELAMITERANHVREVLTGYRLGTAEFKGRGEPRKAYGPDRPLGQRYQAKADELGVSKRTVQRWVRAYRDHGEAGLAALAWGNPHGRTDQRWLDTAEDVMAENADMSRPNKRSVIQQTRARLAAQYGPDVVDAPSRATSYRRLNQIDHHVPTFHGSRQRNRDVAQRPNREYWKLTPTRPGEYMVMDTNCLDVYALDPVTLRWVNVEMTVAMDAYTRCITGMRLTPTTTSLDVAATLFQTYRPLPAPEHWPTSAVWPEHGVPRAVFPDIDALSGTPPRAVCNPAIVPETIVFDHGKSFKNQHINSVCTRMAISIQPAHLREGRDKGIVERFFLSLRTGLLQHLPGYKGPDLYSRGVSPEWDAFFYLDELEQLIRQWIAVVYHNRAHDSLFDPAVPGHHFSPAEMFQHGVERAGYIEAPRDPDLAFEFLRPVRRQILHYGVQYNNRIYNGPGLDGCGHESSLLGNADRRWYIHVNPDDIRRVFFRRPDTRRWHTLYWTSASAIDLPMTEDGVAFARRLAKARGISTDPEAALEAMLDQWNLGLGRSASERRIALRLARERATLTGDLTTDDEPDAEAFIEAQRASRTAISAPITPPAASSDAGDDLDTIDDDDDTDGDIDDATYYSDAFEDA